MDKDLTQSNIERQNILNNRFAVDNMAKALNVSEAWLAGYDEPIYAKAPVQIKNRIGKKWEILFDKQANKDFR